MSTERVVVTVVLLAPICVVLGLGSGFVGGIWRPAPLRSWTFLAGSLTPVVAMGFLALAVFDFHPSMVSISVTIACSALALANVMVGHVVAMSEFGAALAERLDVDGFLGVFDRLRE